MDRYTKFVLTVIAAALVWNSFKDIPLISNAVASSGVVEVRVVDMKLSGFNSIPVKVQGEIICKDK